MLVPVKATGAQNLFSCGIHVGLIRLVFLSVNHSFSFQDLKLQELNSSV